MATLFYSAASWYLVSVSKHMKRFLPSVIFLFGPAMPAWAVLGQAHESVESDTQTLKGRRVMRELNGYTVDEITRPDGAILREYVTPGGQVFGIAWQGMTMPNLKQLLGPSAAAFVAATQTGAGPRHRGPLRVHTDQLVVETGGHMRDFHMRAYRLDLLPQGVSADVVQ